MGRYVSNGGVPATRTAQPQPGESTDDFGRRLASQARKLIDDELGARLGRGASDLNRLSDALRGAGARLEGAAAGPYFERAAVQLEHVAELLQHTSSREMVEGVQRFARERPLMFMGSAVALGIGAGRFLRSTSESTATSESAASRSKEQGSGARGPRQPGRNRARQGSQTSKRNEP